MSLSAFSISLSVKNLEASKAFYEKLGFLVFGGSESMNYLIMKNGDALVGLFHRMFEKNMLTFNPGWDQNAQNLNSFEDVRGIQKRIKEAGIPLAQEANESSVGPASLLIFDPDGNPILIDQHR